MWTKTNKILAIILAITTVALILDFTIKKGGREGFRQRLVEADTSAIAKIVFYSKDKANSLTLIRQNKSWFVQGKGKKYPADRDKIRSVIETLSALSPTQVVANSPKQWADYGVADTNSLNIVVFDKKGKQLAHLYAGKIKTSQGQPSYQYPGRSRTYYTYVRAQGDRNVYLVPQLLAITFINNVDAYRDQTITNIDPMDIQSIALADNGNTLTLRRAGAGWTLNGQSADSTNMANYLRDISHVQGWQFAPDSIVHGLKTLKTLTLLLEHNKQITVKALGDSTVKVLWSSQNPQNYFKAQGQERRLFKGQDYFLAKSKK